jgi:hypothetical protein
LVTKKTTREEESALHSSTKFHFQNFSLEIKGSMRGLVRRLQNRRQLMGTVKYADDLVLLAKEETVLQGMIERLTETGRCLGMEMNVE